MNSIKLSNFCRYNSGLSRLLFRNSVLCSSTCIQNPIIVTSTFKSYHSKRYLSTANNNPPRSVSELSQSVNADGAVDKEIIKTLASFLWPKDAPRARLRVVGAFSSLLLAKLAVVQVPIQLGALVNSLSTSCVVVEPTTMPWILLGSYGLAKLCGSGFNELRTALFASVGQNACRSISRRTFSHVHSLDSNFLLSSKSGDLQTIISRAVRSITGILNMMLFNVVPTLFEFSLVLYILTKTAGISAALITAGTMGCYVVYTTKMTNIRTKFRQKMNSAEQVINVRMLDSITNSESVKYFNNEAFETNRYDDALRRYERENVRVMTSLSCLNFGQQCIFTSGLLAIMSMSTKFVLAGAIPVGDLVTIATLLFQLSIPLNFLGGVYRETRLNLVDMAKLHQLLKLAPQVVDLPNATNLEFLPETSNIEFKNVSFYHGDRQILDNISFTIPPGKKVALVGPSGSGKSTIIKLLLRTFDPNDGEILINNQDIKQVTLQSLRNCMGLVPQDTTLFNESVLDNIRYGRVDADFDSVSNAAKLAQVHDVINQLPEAYHTNVGERGLKLSGGERQRIAIARCILKDCPVILFDEATSSLDTRTEGLILQAVKNMISGGKTSLVVAHRLSTIANADLILYLEDGKIVESGSHLDLMSKFGRYWHLWNDQLYATRTESEERLDLASYEHSEMPEVDKR